jgi:hypothetical protein
MILKTHIGDFIVVRDNRLWHPGLDTALAYAAKANPKEKLLAERVKLVALCVEGVYADQYCVIDTSWAGRPRFSSLDAARARAQSKGGARSIVKIEMKLTVERDPSAQVRQGGKQAAKARRTMDVDDIKFLSPEEWRFARKHPPVRRDARSNLMKSGQPMICRCGAHGPHLEAAHKIPFMIGVLAI